jgi:hypothetical protein
VSSKSDDPNTDLAGMFAWLGEDAARKLLDGVAERKVVLYGRARTRSGVEDLADIIPPHRLRDCEPNGARALRFNLETSNIEANASATFSVFASLAPYGWEDVYAATHQIDALVKSLNGRTASTTKAHKDCYEWLLEKMRASPDAPERKEDCRADALNRWKRQGLSGRAFDNTLWPKAAENAPAPKWSLPGPKKPRLESDHRTS